MGIFIEQGNGHFLVVYIVFDIGTRSEEAKQIDGSLGGKLINLPIPQALINLYIYIFFYLPDQAPCFVKVLARNLPKNIIKEHCWTSSLQPLYLVPIVNDCPQYLYQIPLQYIIHSGPNISFITL